MMVLSDSHFFRLSAELRNEIYRLALPTNSTFEISKDSDPPHEPPLLRVNSQIRNETILIYYQENEWVFPVVNLDASRYIAWSEKSPWRIAANIRWTYRKHGDMCVPYAGTQFHVTDTLWTRLHAWLGAYYRGACLRIEVSKVRNKDGDFESRHLKMAANLFEMVHRLRDDHMLHWPEIEPLLENAHQALASVNTLWSGMARAH